jgi:hypothetical protein
MLHAQISIPKQVACGLKATQALAELLAELHVHFPLTHYVFAKLLPCETTLREERLSFYTPFFCDLGTRCLSPICGFAQELGSVDGCMQPFTQRTLHKGVFLAEP